MPSSRIQDSFLVVPTPGTRLPLTVPSTPCSKVTISADENNGANLSIGGATVVAAVGATRSGTVVSPGGSVAYDIDDLSKVFVDVISGNDKVLFTWTS